jgi:hypothetical protein
MEMHNVVIASESQKDNPGCFKYVASCSCGWSSSPGHRELFDTGTAIRDHKINTLLEYAGIKFEVDLKT